MAQNNSDQFRPFNGFFAGLFDDGSPTPQQQVHNNPDYNSLGTPQPHMVPTRAPQPQPAAQLNNAPSVAPPVGGVDNYNGGSTTRPVPSNIVSPGSATGRNYSFQYDDGTVPSGPALSPPPSGAGAGGDTTTSPAPPAAPAGTLLHERLKTFRQSPFADTTPTTPSAADSSLPPPPSDPPASQATETPQLAQRSPSVPPPADVPPTNAAPAIEPQHPSTAKPAAEAAQEPSVLIDRKSPLLTAETIGSRKIVVGKEAAYEVLLQNSGDLAAEEVSVTVSLPDWAEVTGASASAGEVSTILQGHHDPCRWVLGRIEAHAKEKLSLKIIPKQSKPFELAVRWDFKQAPAQAMIEVQEPKLTLRLDGPREVFFGKHEVYKLKLGNSGNGPAENVLLTLMPLSGGDTHPISHRLGTINSGDERTIEIELTARQAGNVTIRVQASSDGSARADLTEQVLVHRAALRIDAEGPAVQFVGTPANYKIRVRNPGDAPAKNVKLTVKLPTGVKFVSGSEGAISETFADGSKVRWTVDQLAAGEQRILELKCTLALSGGNRMEIMSLADDDVAAAAEMITRVEAMADLRLEVKDPEGPVPVGSSAAYEIHVRNRGTKAAENVEVLAYFSSGVEPISADGQPHRIGPGQVVFTRIPAIPPASELVLKVKAKAAVAGNHVFRAEVHCKTMGIRLVGEQVTHYYQDGPSTQQATSAPTRPATMSETTGQDDLRTAERQAPLPLPPSLEQPLLAPPIKR